MRLRAICAVTALAVVSELQSPACGQAPQQVGLQQAGVVSSGYQRLSGQHNPAIEYFGGGLGRQSRLGPKRAELPTSGLPTRNSTPTKPFSHVQRSYGVSPYLGLDLAESSSGVPNYFAYVRPQLDRIREVEAQRAQLNRLQQQVATQSGNPSEAEPASLNRGTGYRTQFLNTGSYFQVQR